MQGDAHKKAKIFKEKAKIMLIKILNPAPGTATHLGYKHALRYVKQKRAEWAGSHAIRFLPESHRHQSALKQSAIGYDADHRIRTRSELKHVPVAGDLDRLFIVRKRCAA